MYDVVTEAVETGYITFDEAYRLSPSEMVSLVKGRQAKEQRLIDIGRVFFGCSIATDINIHTPKNAKKYKWDDIFRGVQAEQSEEDIEARLEAFGRLMGD